MSDAKEETLLIVDDEEINRAILANIFSSEYAIIEAEDGQESLDLIESNPNGLSAILLDVVMPRLNGIEVLRRLYQTGLTQRIPVFLITADIGSSTMREAYNLGVMDVIQKPVVPYIVRRRVNSVVELFRARRRLGAEVERQRDQLLLQAQQLAEMGMGMVEALATAIEFRSDESGEHVHRIHDITCHLLSNTPLGEGLTQEQIRQIGLGAVTHDVGKISIPDAILNKKGRLTAEEFELMKTHTIRGAELLSRIPQMREHAAYRHRPAPPRALGRPGTSRRSGGRPDPHLDPDRVAGRRVRRPGEQAVLQGRLPRPDRHGHDPAGRVRRLQSQAAGVLLPGGAGAAPILSACEGSGLTMDENKKQLLEEAGIDVADALTRFMDNEALMLKFLLRFPEDKNFPLLKQAMDSGDAAQAFEAAHTLKGVAGNLAMTELFQQVSLLTEDLREQDLSAARARMPALEACYARIIAVLRELS